MATKPTDLSHAFTGANPDDYRLSRVLMVGGLHDSEHGMSQNDGMMLRMTLAILDKWQVPLGDELNKAREFRDYMPSPKAVRIINILPEQGGEDFLKSEEKGDIAILCNIAKDVPDEAIMSRNNKAYLNLHHSVRASFSSSADHKNLKKWKDQLENCGAKIVMVTNSDGFDLADIATKSFVSIDVPHRDDSGKGMGMLVRRDYLSAIEDYLVIQSLYTGKDSPLLRIAEEAPRDQSATYRCSIATGKVVAFPSPGKP